jgi:hypothetical protein
MMHSVKIIWYLFTTVLGTRASVVGRGTMLQAERSPVRVPDEADFFQFTLSFQTHYGPGVDSNRNEYQESSLG